MKRRNQIFGNNNITKINRPLMCFKKLSQIYNALGKSINIPKNNIKDFKSCLMNWAGVFSTLLKDFSNSLNGYRNS